MNLVVEGVWVAGIQIDKGGNFLGMAGTDGAELFASDRVSDEDGVGDIESVDDGENVVTEAVCLVVGGGGSRSGRGPEAATGDAVDVIGGSKFRGEFVVDVGVVAEAGEEDEWTSGATPVENFELYVFVDGDELDFVR